MRHFVARKSIPLLICQSFAKNAGLYGERVGALHVVSATPEQSAAVFQPIGSDSEVEISNPPAFGARVVKMILTDKALFEQWQKTSRRWAGRIITMRQSLFDLLTRKFKTPGNWITSSSRSACLPSSGSTSTSASAFWRRVTFI